MGRATYRYEKRQDFKERKVRENSSIVKMKGRHDKKPFKCDKNWSIFT
jgi:hypothetical protein